MLSNKPTSPHTPNLAPQLKLEQSEISMLIYKARSGEGITSLEKQQLQQWRSSNSEAEKRLSAKIQELIALFKNEEADPVKVKELFKNIFGGQITEIDKKSAFSLAKENVSQVKNPILRSCLEYRYSAYKNTPPTPGLTAFDAAILMTLDISSGAIKTDWRINEKGLKGQDTFDISFEEHREAFFREIKNLFPTLTPEQIEKIQKCSLLVTTKRGVISIPNTTVRAEISLEKKVTVYIQQLDAYNAKNNASSSIAAQQTSSNKAIQSVTSSPETEAKRTEEFKGKVAELTKNSLKDLNLSPAQLQAVENILQKQDAVHFLEKSIKDGKQGADFARDFFKIILGARLTPELSKAIAQRMVASFHKLMTAFVKERELAGQRLYDSHAASMADIQGKRERTPINSSNIKQNTSERKPTSAKDSSTLGKYKQQEEQRLLQLQSDGIDANSRKAMAEKHNFSCLHNHPENIQHLGTYVDLDSIDEEYEHFLEAVILGVEEFKTLQGYLGFLLEIGQNNKLDSDLVKEIFEGIRSLVKAEGQPKQIETPKKDYDVFSPEVQYQLINQINNSSELIEALIPLFKMNTTNNDLNLFSILMSTRTIQSLENQLFAAHKVFQEQRNKATGQKEMVEKTIRLIEEQERGLFQNVLFAALKMVETGRKVTPQLLFDAAAIYTQGVSQKNKPQYEVEEVDPRFEQLNTLYNIFHSANGFSSQLATVVTFNMSTEAQKALKPTIVTELDTLMNGSETLEYVLENYFKRKPLANSDKTALQHALVNLAGLGKQRSPQAAIEELQRQYDEKKHPPKEVSIKMPTQNELDKRRQTVLDRVIRDLQSPMHAESYKKLFGEKGLDMTIVNKIVDIAFSQKMPMPTTHAIAVYFEQLEETTPAPIASQLRPGVAPTARHTNAYGSYTSNKTMSTPTPPNISQHLKQ